MRMSVGYQISGPAESQWRTIRVMYFEKVAIQRKIHMGVFDDNI